MRFAIAGTGKVARQNYLPILRALPGGELALWNRTPATARETAAAVGAEAFESLSDLAGWGPDAAFVLTSEQAHAEVAEALIRGGVPVVFVEKPLVAAAGQAHVGEADFQRARDLMELAAERRCRVAMMFNYRFFEQSIEAARAAHRPGWGRLTAATGLVHYACWSHAIDLIRWFGGDYETVTALSGDIARQSMGLDAPDVGAAFTLSSGAVGTLVGTAGLAWQHPLFEITLNYEGGRLHLRDLDGDLEILDRAANTHEVVRRVRDQSRWDAYGASFGRALRAFCEALANGRPFPVSGADGLAELRFEAALKRSAAQGRRVCLAEEFPL